MHIDQAKTFIIEALKDSGLKPYNVKGATGDFRVFPSQKEKRIQILVLNGSQLRTELPILGEKIQTSLEGGCEIKHEDGRSYFSNQTWETKERKKKLPTTGVVTDSSSPPADKQEKEDKMRSPETSTNDLREDFNTELRRLAGLGNKFENLLDEFMLNRLSTKQLLEQLFDGFEKVGIRVYTTSVAIQVVGDKFVIPHITKETFVLHALKCVKKE